MKQHLSRQRLPPSSPRSQRKPPKGIGVLGVLGGGFCGHRLENLDFLLNHR
jgi:hypothetical protein